MEDAIRRFLTYLDVERGASGETIRSYRSDLRQFMTFLQKGPRDEGTAPEQVDASLIRRFLVWLSTRGEKNHHRRGNSPCCGVCSNFCINADGSRAIRRLKCGLRDSVNAYPRS